MKKEEWKYMSEEKDEEFPVQDEIDEMDADEVEEDDVEEDEDDDSTALAESDDDEDTKKKMDYCCMCHRTESQGAKLLRMPNNISICTDCMQKSFDSFSSGFGGNNGIQFLDLSNMDINSIRNMNLGDLLTGNMTAQKVKPKRRRRKRKKKRRRRNHFPSKISRRRTRSRQSWMSM